MNYEPWMLAVLDKAGFNGIKDKHLNLLVEAILATGLKSIDQRTFESCCRKCGIEPQNFKQKDLDRLEQILNQQ